MLNKKNLKKHLSIIFIFVAMITAFINVNVTKTKASTTETLNVSLYQYVPDPVRFENAVQEKWKTIEPNVKLNFVNWDCYSDDPSNNLDVFVFDAIYLPHFINSGYLSPISQDKIENKNDLLRFALDGCTVNGITYALPQIMCTNLLYSRKDDVEVSNVTNVEQLYNILGSRKSTDIIPKNNEGLLIDMSGGTTKVCTYLDSLIDTTQKYSDFYILPDLNSINKDAMNSLVMLQSMAGKEQANYSPDNNDSYIRADWFKNGKGRAYIGYSESMSRMGDFANDVNFRTLSLSNNSDIPVFYGDVVGINSNIKDEYKKNLATKLTSVISDESTLVTALSPDSNNKYPQYLLPARYSVYNDLKNNYPIYNKLLNIVSNNNNKLFKLGPNVRSWMPKAKSIIPEYLNDK